MKRKATSPPKPGATGSASGLGRGAPLYPHGIEVLLHRAASDRVFREQLLEQRAGAAAAIGLELDPAEKAMLESIPGTQLRLTIERFEAAGEPRRGFLIKLAVATLVTVAAGGLWLWSRREPSYKGKSLSEWLRLGEQFGWNYSPMVYAFAGIVPKNWRPEPRRVPAKPEMAEVEEALKAMGTQAVPQMIAMLGARDPAWKLKLMSWLGKQSVLKIHLTRAETHQKRALIGLTVLGPQATNAVPAIEQAMAAPANAHDWVFQAYAREALEKITGKP